MIWVWMTALAGEPEVLLEYTLVMDDEQVAMVEDQSEPLLVLTSCYERLGRRHIFPTGHRRLIPGEDVETSWGFAELEDPERLTLVSFTASTERSADGWELVVDTERRVGTTTVSNRRVADELVPGRLIVLPVGETTPDGRTASVLLRATLIAPGTSADVRTDYHRRAQRHVTTQPRRHARRLLAEHQDHLTPLSPP